MNQVLTVLAMFSFLIIGPASQVNALTFDDLPVTQSSKQWSVEVGDAEGSQESVKPKKGVYDTYSFKVKNIGKDISEANIQAFGNDLNSKTKFGLFDILTDAKVNQRGQEFTFANFPLSVTAIELEIVINWKENSNDREFKETFVFTQKRSIHAFETFENLQNRAFQVK
ncbi:hypothetical protein LJR015_002821 [Peribacillus frigoritolerans]|uniref:hypothetical protein n=1 Tax=Peribacillus frigoritolerans TaxID=450367 RepID=UPI003ECC450B